MDPYKIIRNPISTEKAIKLMESENKLIFIVEDKTTKSQIKEAVEQIFKVKVKSVNTHVTSKGEKRAFVRLSSETPAIDIATQIGMM